MWIGGTTDYTWTSNFTRKGKTLRVCCKGTASLSVRILKQYHRVWTETERLHRELSLLGMFPGNRAVLRRHRLQSKVSTVLEKGWLLVPVSVIGHCGYIHLPHITIPIFIIPHGQETCILILFHYSLMAAYQICIQSRTRGIIVHEIFA